MSQIEELKNKIEILKKKRDELEALAKIQEVFQHSYKIYLNSVYGFTGTQYSPVFSIDLAEAVTSTGRMTIQEMVRFTNKALNKIDSGATGIEDHVIAGDTDSFFEYAKIYVNEQLMTISSLYKVIKMDGKEIKFLNGTEVVMPLNQKFITKSINGNTEIKNVSRHKVNKEKWMISINGKETFLTKDHSIMVYRDGYVIECKPENIKNTDYLLEYDK